MRVYKKHVSRPPSNNPGARKAWDNILEIFEGHEIREMTFVPESQSPGIILYDAWMAIILPLRDMMFADGYSKGEAHTFYYKAP